LYAYVNKRLALVGRKDINITDLHRHIEQLNFQHFDGHHSGNICNVYRGQGLSETDFDQLKNTKGGLIAFNSFLSTSKHYSVSLMYAESNSNSPDMVGILFVLTVDPTQTTTPFASITEVGYQGDKENDVLFSIRSVFRIRDLNSMGEDNRLYQVDLILTSDNDKDLQVLTELIRQETQASTAWHSLGQLLHKTVSSTRQKKFIKLYLIGLLMKAQKHPFTTDLPPSKMVGENIKRPSNYMKKHLKSTNKLFPPNHPDLGSSYNNIGGVYRHMGEYSKAVSN